jgi:hypothetical protein
MIEIFQIFFQLLIFIFITYFPFNSLTFPKISIYYKSEFFYFFFNIIVLLNILLFASFFSVNLYYLFGIIFFLYFLIFIFYFKKIFLKIYEMKNLLIKLAFIVSNLFLFFEIASNLTIGWDGLSIWLNKANNFYNGKNYFDLNSSYPHLGSYLWAFFWKNSFLQLEYLGRLFIVYVYLVTIFLLSSLLTGYKIFTKLLVIFFLIFFSYVKDLHGYQDILIFSILSALSILLILPYLKNKLKKKNNYFFFLILSVNLLPWIKNEGVIYAIFIILLFLISNNLSNLQKFLLLIFGLLNILFQILIVKIFFQNQLFQTPLNIEILLANFLNLKELIYRIFYITIYIFHSFFKYPIVLIGFSSVLISLIFKQKVKLINFYIIFFLLNMSFIYFTYITTLSPIIWHLQTSIKRLMFQTSGFYVVLLLLLINKKEIKIS